MTSRFVLMASFVMLTLISCAGPPVATNVQLLPNPNKNAPLAGILTFTADRPVSTTLIIDDGTRADTIQPDSTFKTNHELLVLGLNPDKTHQVTAILRDEKGRELVLDSLSITTPPLPDDFPALELVQQKTGEMEPGITMFTVFRWKEPFDDDSEWGYAIAVDDTGEVVWYLKTDYWVDEVRRKHNGNLMLGGVEDGRVFEIDMLGNTIQEWHSAGAVTKPVTEASIAVDTDMFHHDVLELASGNFLGLGLEVRSLKDFPVEYPPSNKKRTADVAGDVIIEFAPNGSTIREWSLVDILDPRRLGDGSLRGGHYYDIYKDRYDPLPYDITHSNAIYYIEEEDAVLVSSNFQCAIYKIDMKTGNLLWILGDPTGWEKPWSDKLLKPKGNLTWPCHQHGVEMTPQGTILMYDNGGARFIPPNPPMPDEERFSRALELRVDEAAGTVEEIWSYGPEKERFISPFISDADYMPTTGNVLITDGGRFKDEDGNLMTDFGGHQWARILEVTKEPATEKIWELHISDPEIRYSVYRAQRLYSLYPKLDRPTG
ncbi:aryl-sulfate sulfotransferase [uncultured Eudoraea sp.]|uniref:aryl-sulfate sulfotransferase n=1 Tax=uncultured Eudoraea sp. TaxID=1035614 RepID=UPI002634D40C|nr:aryl-sulfate sulfotransferase [uncultured Eudoraea sp.]